jgi:Fe2+ transport system protein FeoA
VRIDKREKRRAKRGAHGGGCKRLAGCCECPVRVKKDLSNADLVKLSDYGPGQKGVIQAICGSPDFRLRLMEMGFVPGTEVKVIKYAPLTDPIEFVVKGYHLSLRRDEAAGILMDQPEKAA